MNMIAKLKHSKTMEIADQIDPVTGQPTGMFFVGERGPMSIGAAKRLRRLMMELADGDDQDQVPLYIPGLADQPQSEKLEKIVADLVLLSSVAGPLKSHDLILLSSMVGDSKNIPHIQEQIRATLLERLEAPPAKAARKPSPGPSA